MLIRLGLNPSPLGLGLEGNKGVLSKKKVFPNLAIFAGLRKNGLTGESKHMEKNHMEAQSLDL